MILQITPQEIAEKMKKEAEERLNNIAKKIKKVGDTIYFASLTDSNQVRIDQSASCDKCSVIFGI